MSSNEFQETLAVLEDVVMRYSYELDNCWQETGVIIDRLDSIVKDMTECQ